MSNRLWFFLWGLIFAAASSAPAHALVILQYHHISAKTPAVTSTTPELFAEHLQLIEQAGFKVVSLRDVAAALRRKEALPDKAVLLTFDDGYDNLLTDAYPYLKERGWPFTIFINSGPLNERKAGYLTWDQLREMAKHGAEIANHSHTHLHFLRKPNELSDTAWRKRIWDEINTTEQAIKKEIGHHYKTFSYPYGEFNAASEALLAKRGFLGMGQHSGAVMAGQTTDIPRFPMGGTYGNTKEFLTKLNTLPMPLAKWQLQTDEGNALADGVLPQAVTRPWLVLEFKAEGAAAAKRLTCYVGGATAEIEYLAQQVRVRAPKPLPSGRSRYNCTAPAASGRFYWFSVPFVRKRDDGSWVPEP